MEHLTPFTSLTAFKRVLIKISGEALAGTGNQTIDWGVLQNLSHQLVNLSNIWEIALVVGGGNFFRGAKSAPSSFSRDVADGIGMLGTMMNGLLLQQELKRQDLEVHLFSSLEVKGLSETFYPAQVDRYFGARKIVIFTGGTGQPYFTTDTAAVVWALRSRCQAVLKGTKVDGVFSADPIQDSTATFFPNLTYAEAIQKKLGIMDLTALALASDACLPLVVFNIQRPKGISSVLEGRPPFTWIE